MNELGSDTVGNYNLSGGHTGAPVKLTNKRQTAGLPPTSNAIGIRSDRETESEAIVSDNTEQDYREMAAKLSAGWETELPRAIYFLCAEVRGLREDAKKRSSDIIGMIRVEGDWKK